MISIYKPNKKNEGCACSFSLGNDGSIFINAVQQFSWDENKKTGSFSENAKNKDKSIAIKLNAVEAGGIINAIERMADWKAYHSYEDNTTQIQLTVWEKTDFKTKEPTGEKAFGLSLLRNSTDKFKLPIELGEAQLIKQFLIWCLNEIFFADLNAQKKKNTNTQ